MHRSPHTPTFCPPKGTPHSGEGQPGHRGTVFSGTGANWSVELGMWGASPGPGSSWGTTPGLQRPAWPSRGSCSPQPSLQACFQAAAAQQPSSGAPGWDKAPGLSGPSVPSCTGARLAPTCEPFAFLFFFFFFSSCKINLRTAHSFFPLANLLAIQPRRALVSILCPREGWSPLH